MRRLAIVLILGAAALAAVAPAQAREGKFFAVQLHYAFTSLDGTGRTVEDGIMGTEFDVDRTLGIGDDEAPEANLWFHAGRHSVLLSYLRSQFEGDDLLEEDLVFGSTMFPAGLTLETRLEFALGKLHYNFRFLDSDLLDFGLLVGADLYTGDGRLELPDAGLTESGDFNAPFPVLGLNLTVRPVGGLVIYVEATGLVADVGDVDGSVLDAQARLTWYILDSPFGLSAGYRYLDLDLDSEEDGTADLQQSGYYLGLALRF